MINPKDLFPDELQDKPISSKSTGKLPPVNPPSDIIEDLPRGAITEQPTGEYSPEEMIRTQLSEAYPLMEELPLKPPPQQYPIQPLPANEMVAQPQQPMPLEVGEILVTRREEAQHIIDYLFWILLGLELIFLTRLLLKLIGANPNNLFAGFLYGLSNFLLFPFLGLAPSLTIQPLNQPLEISTLVGMFVYFLIFIMLVRFVKIRLYPGSKYADEVSHLEPPKAPNERAFASKFAITQVGSFYENVHGQFKSWLYFSVIAITLGTLCIVSIYIISYLGKFFPISDNVTTIIIIIIAACSLYSIALLSFLQNRKAVKQVDSYYSDKLNEVAKNSQLITLASRVPVSESQEHINEKIISQILLPLDKENIGQENFKTVSDELLKLEHKK